MTIKEFIEKHLQNCEYGAELSKEVEQEAKENGFVVVFGASDDLCEFRGAVEDEAECWCGGNLYINSKGDIVGNEQPDYKRIEAVWGKFDNKRTSHNGKYADEECVVQYHPPKSEYVNFHPYCLHLWRKVGENFETPPKHFVG